MGTNRNLIAPDPLKVRVHDMATEARVVMTLLNPKVDARLRKQVISEYDANLFSDAGICSKVYRSIQQHITRTRSIPDKQMLTEDHRVHPHVRTWLMTVGAPSLRNKTELDNALDLLVSYRGKRAIWDSMVALGKTLEADKYDEDSARVIVETLSRSMTKSGGMTETRLDPRAPDLQQRVRRVLAQARERQAQRWPTGWPTVDKMMLGGIAAGETMILASNSGGGKSMAALAMAMHMVSRGARVCYLSFEMQETQVMLRLLAREAGFTRAQLASGQLGEAEIQAAVDRFCACYSQYGGKLRVLTPQRGFARPDLAYVESVVEREPTDVVFVDYMSMLAAINERGTTEEQRLRQASEGLVMLGSATQSAVVAMAQLNEEGQLKYSKGMREAVTCLLKWDSSAANNTGTGAYRIDIAKSRETDGDTPDHFWVQQDYDHLRIPEIEAPAEKPQKSINDFGGM